MTLSPVGDGSGGAKRVWPWYLGSIRRLDQITRDESSCRGETALEQRLQEASQGARVAHQEPLRPTGSPPTGLLLLSDVEALYRFSRSRHRVSHALSWVHPASLAPKKTKKRRVAAGHGAKWTGKRWKNDGLPRKLPHGDAV